MTNDHWRQPMTTLVLVDATHPVPDFASSVIVASPSVVIRPRVWKTAACFSTTGTAQFMYFHDRQARVQDLRFKDTCLVVPIPVSIPTFEHVLPHKFCSLKSSHFLPYDKVLLHLQPYNKSATSNNVVAHPNIPTFGASIIEHSLPSPA
jgi:hypothetical protein